MKRILILCVLYIMLFSFNAYALTFKDNYVYTKEGDKITLDDYKLIRKYYKYTDDVIDMCSSGGTINYYINNAKDILYSGKYLVKVTFYKDNSNSVKIISKEDALMLLENGVKEDNEYRICKPEIMLEKVKVDYEIVDEYKDILTYKDINYDKYCDSKEILNNENVIKENNTDDKNGLIIFVLNNFNKFKYLIISAILLIIIIITSYVINRRKLKTSLM